METIDILKKLVSFNTIKDLQNNEIIEWIKQYLEQYGFECNEKGNNKKCLIVSIGKDPILGFSGHLDTVNIADGWESNPFELKIKDGRIYGLGACDMKGGMSAFLKACTNIDKSKLKNGLKLYFTFDEETDFEGIKVLTGLNEKFPKHIIIAEPTDMKPVIATKGCIEAKVTFFGKSTHSSTPDLGKNAIIEANKFIQELLVFSQELRNEKNDIFSIPYTTINIGKIEGGDSTNKVPDKCVVMFDARTVYEKHNGKIAKDIEKILKKYDSEFEIGINIFPKINNNDKMITMLEELCNSQRTAENYVTEASFINNSEVVIIGPGPNTSHQSNEHIEIQKLNDTVKIYERIIEKYCY